MTQGPPTQRAPVAVHRWWADSEGWAYDPWFDEGKRLSELAGLLNDQLKKPLADAGGRIDFVVPGFDGWLVGYRDPDPAPLDARAAHRNPSILRVAFLNRKRRPSEAAVAAVRESLARARPAKRGSGELTVPIAGPAPLRSEPFPPSLGVQSQWRQLAGAWLHVAKTRTDESKLLADDWYAAGNPKTVGVDEFLDGAEGTFPVVAADDPAAFFLASRSRCLVAGPCAPPPVDPAAPPAPAPLMYAVHLFEAVPGRWVMKFTRYVELPAPPKKRGFLWRLFSDRGVEWHETPETIRDVMTAAWAGFTRMPGPAYAEVIRDGVKAGGGFAPDDFALAALAWMIPVRR